MQAACRSQMGCGQPVAARWGVHVPHADACRSQMGCEQPVAARWGVHVTHADACRSQKGCEHTGKHANMLRWVQASMPTCCGGLTLTLTLTLTQACRHVAVGPGTKTTTHTQQRSPPEAAMLRSKKCRIMPGHLNVKSCQV